MNLQRRSLLGLPVLALAPWAGGCSGTAAPVGAPGGPGFDVQRTRMLAVAGVGEQVFCVGERGSVSRSADRGASWQALSVAGPETLTSLATHDGTSFLAVGHGGAAYRSVDRCASWQRTLDGAALARTELEQAGQAATPADPAAAQHLAAARQLVSDGPDKPLLSVAFSSATAATAVGAYGLMTQTQDAGASWLARMATLDNPKGLHLNAVACRGALQLIAGEQGLGFLSQDQGHSFQRLALPGKASLFAPWISPGGSLWLGGLNGRLLRGAGPGRPFEDMSLAGAPTVTSMVELDDGRLLLGHVTGRLSLLTPEGRLVRTVAARDVAQLADLHLVSGAVLIGASLRGPRQLPLRELLA